MAQHSKGPLETISLACLIDGEMVEYTFSVDTNGRAIGRDKPKGQSAKHIAVGADGIVVVSRNVSQPGSN